MWRPSRDSLPRISVASSSRSPGTFLARSPLLPPQFPRPPSSIIANSTADSAFILVVFARRSLELAPAYEKAKEAQDKATANSTENMQNKREIAKEFKAYKEHKSEATKLTKLRKEKVLPYCDASRVLRCN